MASNNIEERVKSELQFELKSEQLLAVTELIRGKDVLAVLPTGFGKSRIYQAFTSLKNSDTNHCTLVLVICPLVGLIKDQIHELKILGYVAANLSDLSTEEMKTCEFNILLSSAEEVTRDDFQRELKDNTSQIHKRFSCLVVDECHTVETWTGKRRVCILLS
jgi:ATP-dependent DNA helicase RecQ